MVRVGNPNKNENFAAVSRSNPKNKAVVNVEPERDTPGIKASVCPNPTKIPSRICSESKPRLRVPIFLPKLVKAP